MTDRERILIALREKPLKAFEIMKRAASGLPALHCERGRFRIKKCLRPNRLALQAMTCSPARSCQFLLPGMVTN